MSPPPRVAPDVHGTVERPDVSVVIVHYETPDLLLDCLHALRSSRDAERFQVFVIDNGSRSFDAAACRAVLPGVTVIENGENLGFSRASNIGLRRASGRYLLLLNPDAIVAPETIATMREYLDQRPEVGAATCRLELPDGSLDLACRRLFPTPARSFYRVTLLSRLFPRSRQFGQYNLTYLDEWEETEIDQPCGAFMMVRRTVADAVGFLDEDYFMYGEDIDWAYRIKQAGWRIMYTPITTVRHVKRASSRQDRARTIRWFHDSMRIFYRKHYRAVYPTWVTGLVMTGIALRERTELALEAARGRRA